MSRIPIGPNPRVSMRQTNKPWRDEFAEDNKDVNRKKDAEEVVDKGAKEAQMRVKRRARV